MTETPICDAVERDLDLHLAELLAGVGAATPAVPAPRPSESDRDTH
jgi:hypothetical protein